MTALPPGRTRSLLDTLQRVHPLLADFGITRVAEQTGLDRIGLPCFASFRPNARSLSTHHGKGQSALAARVSAIMEAVEYAVAEAPMAPAFHGNTSEAAIIFGRPFWPHRLLPSGRMDLPGEPIEWCRGFGAWSNVRRAVPFDAVLMTGRAKDLPGICQTTNGLASGNTIAEAKLHALCELIERDANSIWNLLPIERQLASAMAPGVFESEALEGMVGSCIAAGCDVRLFDHTSNVGVPVVAAMLLERHEDVGRFRATAGYAAHPVAEIAALKALAEAIQSRITAIAGARDDIAPGTHEQALEASVTQFFDASRDGSAPAPKSIGEAGEVAALLGGVLRGLRDSEIEEPVVVDLTAGAYPFAVVRALSNDLEDFEANTNWRPGARALRWGGLQ